MVCKTLYIWQWRWVTLRGEKKTRWALWLTSLHLWVSRLFKEDKPRWSPVITLGSGKKPKSRKTKASGAHGTERQRSEGRTERKRQRSARPPPSGFSREVTSRGRGAKDLKLKTTFQRVRGNTASSHPGPGIVSVPISQTGKPQDAWDNGKNNFHWFCLGRKNKLWPSTALISPNKY